MVAQGKAAEAAALGKEPPHPPSFFLSGLARGRRAKPERRKEAIILRPQPRAALVPSLPGAIYQVIPPELQLAAALRVHRLVMR